MRTPHHRWKRKLKRDARRARRYRQWRAKMLAQGLLSIGAAQGIINRDWIGESPLEIFV